jgi:hypothetical protein
MTSITREAAQADVAASQATREGQLARGAEAAGEELQV